MAASNALITNTKHVNSFIKIYKISVWLELSISAITIIISLCYCWRKGQPRYLRGFPVYFMMSLLSDLLYEAFEPHRGIIIWIFTMFEALFFSYFFFLIFEAKQRRILIKVMACSFLLLALTFFFLLPPLHNMVLATLLESFILVLPCTLYYRQMLSRRQIIGMNKNPAFFIVTGIFFYFLIQFPVILFTVFYYYAHNKPLASLVYSMNNFSQFISYLLFIKAMLCLVNRT
jgi:hypothetical protein